MNPAASRPWGTRGRLLGIMLLYLVGLTGSAEAGTFGERNMVEYQPEPWASALPAQQAWNLAQAAVAEMARTGTVPPDERLSDIWTALSAIDEPAEFVQLTSDVAGCLAEGGLQAWAMALCQRPIAPAQRAAVLLAVADARERRGDKAAVRTCMEMAAQEGYKVTGPSERVGALLSIAEAGLHNNQTDIARGCLDEAAAAVGQVLEVENRVDALATIGELRLEVGEKDQAATAFRAAVAALRTLPGAPPSSVLERIAKGQAQAEKGDEARQTASLVDDLHIRSYTLRTVAEIDLAGGRIRAALATCRHVERPEDRLPVLLKIFRETAQGKDMAAANEARGEALQAARLLGRPDQQATAFARIAEATLKAGDLAATDAALTEGAMLAATIPDPGLRRRAQESLNIVRQLRELR